MLSQPFSPPSSQTPQDALLEFLAICKGISADEIPVHGKCALPTEIEKKKLILSSFHIKKAWPVALLGETE